MVHAVEILKQHHARKIYMVFIHPVLSEDGPQRLSELPVEQFIALNTIPISPEKKAYFGDRLVVLSIGELLGEVILRANQGTSVGAMFNE